MTYVLSSPEPIQQWKEVVPMAGNQTDARIRAQNALKDAEKNLGKDDPATKALKSRFDAAQATENAATGSSGQARTPGGF